MVNHARRLRLLKLCVAFGAMVPLDHLTSDQWTKYFIHVPTYYVGLATLPYALWLFVWLPSSHAMQRAPRWAMRGAAIVAAVTAVALAFIEGGLVSCYPEGLLVSVYFVFPALIVGAAAGLLLALLTTLILAIAPGTQPS